MNSLSSTRLSTFHARHKTRSVMFPYVCVYEGLLLSILGKESEPCIMTQVWKQDIAVIAKCFPGPLQGVVFSLIETLYNVFAFSCCLLPYNAIPLIHQVLALSFCNFSRLCKSAVLVGLWRSTVLIHSKSKMAVRFMYHNFIFFFFYSLWKFLYEWNIFLAQHIYI